MYKSILPSIAFYACGSRGPRVFLTDDAEAEFKAFQKVFLSVCLSVCKIVNNHFESYLALALECSSPSHQGRQKTLHAYV